MKITFDHNCLIALANHESLEQKIREIIDVNTECYIVNVGASEMRERGLQPGRYDQFEEFLESIGISELKRLNPMGIYGVAFYDHSIGADDEMIDLAQKIESVLFNNQTIEIIDHDSQLTKKQINRLCDIHGLWSHIYHKNDVFLTSDRNFLKQTKLDQLIKLGVGAIMHPAEFKP